MFDCRGRIGHFVRKLPGFARLSFWEQNEYEGVRTVSSSDLNYVWPQQKHALGITHHQNSPEESETPSDEGDALVASKHLCFMSITQRHDQEYKICTSPTDKGENPQHAEGHHARTHTHTTQGARYWRFVRPSTQETQRNS